MAEPLEYVGSIHIILGPYRGNPVALYLRRNEGKVVISPKVYPFNSIAGEAETPNKAAADFEEKWKAKALVAPDMYDGPNWEGGIKPERPAPPKPAAAPKPAPGAAAEGAAKPAAPAKPAPAASPAQAAPASQATSGEPRTDGAVPQESAPTSPAQPERATVQSTPSSKN
ncbi:MAG TPA: hypothetical protein VLA99_12550 [Nitrospiraceae bacterium]|nr:hypothetical protein [Nitrospiraceae bacterium]